MLYSNSEIFLDAIALLINVNDQKSQRVVNELVDIISENMRNLVSETTLIKFLIRLIKEIIANQLTTKNVTELTMLLLKFKSDPAVSQNEEVYQQLRVLFSSESSVTNDKLIRINDKINNFIIWNKCNLYTRKMFGYLNRCADTVDPTDQKVYLNDVLNVSKDISAAFDLASMVNSGGRVEKIDFMDKNSIKLAKDTYTERKEYHIMKTGLQGFNMMCGKRGGITLGESVIFNALSYHGKSLLLKLLAKWIVTYNVPPVHPQGKKPLILFLSLENEANEDMMWWFRNAYETNTNSSADNLSDEYVIQYIYDFFSEKGYHFVVERYLPSEFGFDEFRQTYEKYENSGYFIVATLIDYINCMKKSSSTGKSTSVGNHLLVKELYSNLCNYTKSKGTLLGSAHQLNRGAADIVASGIANPVKRFNASHMADSLDVQREVDLSIYLCIEKNQAGDSYMTFKRDKHRYVDDTPEAHKFFAYKFTEFGIVDDIYTKPTYTRDIYSDGSKVDNGNETAEAKLNSMF
jgi:hypothetical protein